MQSLKYILPVAAVLILISVGMYYYGENRTPVDSETALQDSLQVQPVSQISSTPATVTGGDRGLDISWVDLADVTFEDKYYKEIDGYLLFPSFGERVKSYENKVVNLPGYILPINPDSNVYVLSAFTLSSCFFCGAAGPESVVLLELKEGFREFQTDEWLTFKGTLRLNDSDINKLNYILEEAEEIETKSSNSDEDENAEEGNE